MGSNCGLCRDLCACVTSQRKVVMQLVVRPFPELNSDCSAETAKTRGLGYDNSGNS